LLSTPLSPCRRYHPAGGVQRVSQIALNSVVFASSPQARPPGLLIPRLHHVCFRYSLVTRDHPFDGLVGRLQNFGFPPPCYPSYGTPTFVPVGLTPTGCASLCWTHGPAQRSLTFGLPARRSPKATLCTEGFSRFVTSTTAPIATGWSDSCRAGLTPAGRPCLGTAH
jgi:hypothetical protein